MPIDEFEPTLRALFAEHAAAIDGDSARRLAARDYRPRTHRRVPPIALTAASLAVGASVLAAVVSGPGTPSSPGGSNGHTTPLLTVSSKASKGEATSGAIQLDGYVVTVPAGYKTGPRDTNCTAQLHLSAHEQRRLISRSDELCPLMISAVVSAPPPGATERTLPSVAFGNNPAPPAIRFYNVTGPGSGGITTYLPAKLPDGRVVYVSFDPRLTRTLGMQQIVQLELGLHVSPAPKPCTGNCG